MTTITIKSGLTAYFCSERYSAALPASQLSRISRRCCVFFTLPLLFTLMFPGWVSAQHVALVIGNNAYSAEATLQNPVNDARAVGNSLRRMGYDHVLVASDTSVTDIDTLLDEFSVFAEQAEVALIYYAGHGIQVEGENFIVPVNVELKKPRDLKKLVPLKDFTDEVERASRFGLVVLDACRDNPFTARLSDRVTRGSATRGLSRVADVGNNSLVAYATAADQVAEDGELSHSPYAAALLKFLETPELEVFQLFGKIRDEVMSKTAGRQVPYLYGSLGGDRYFLHPGGTVDSDESFTDNHDLDLALWQLAERLGTESAYRDYLRRFSDSIFSPFAVARLNAVAQSNGSPLNNTDLTEVFRQFEKLRASIAAKKWQPLLASETITPASRSKIQELQSSNLTLEANVTNIRVRGPTQSVYAELQVKKIDKKSKSVSIAMVLPLSATRTETGWTEVLW